LTVINIAKSNDVSARSRNIANVASALPADSNSGDIDSIAGPWLAQWRGR
jgi:hypothetical protein